MTGEFNRQRLTIARQKRGLTKTRLAAAAEVTTRSITAWESGETEPTDETLRALAHTLRFPKEFFLADALDVPDVAAVSFRALSSMTAGKRDSARATSALAMELSAWIEARFVLPSADVPDLSSHEAGQAAEILRTQWGLGELPIKNTVHLLESRGVRVFSLADECRDVDAFSFWSGSKPFVILNTIKSAERSRFDAMHELGHLVLHRAGLPDGREAEQQADAFAAAMLMPRADVLARARHFATLPSLIQGKKRWLVSVAALAHQLRALDLVSEWQYRTLCIQIAQRGYRTREPESCPRETSQLLKKVFDALKTESVSRTAVAEELCLPVQELEALVFGLVLTSVAGERVTPRSRVTTRPNLRLVSKPNGVGRD